MSSGPGESGRVGGALVPLDSRPLFAPLLRELLALLADLSPEEWEKRASTSWTVRDVAAHLLDGDCRQLSFGRDARPLLPPERPIHGPDDFLAFLDGLNADWVKASKRLSPALLVDLLDLTGRQVEAYFASLDLDDEAVFGVAWAGEERSRNWMHLARELSERLHHQQQIRRATGRPLLADPAIVGAGLEVLLYGLRPAYSSIEAAPGTAIAVRFGAPVDLEYSLVRSSTSWEIREKSEAPAAEIELDPEIAWLALTRSIPKSEAVRHAKTSGSPSLTGAFFEACSIHKRPVEG
jgi:uncharacterized protein (TIGR03083 family)